MPRCLGTVGSVRTKQMQKSESCAPLVHTFCPLTTKWSSYTSAARRQAGEVTPRAGLAHAEARRALTAQHGQRESFALLGRAVVDDGRREDRDALDVPRPDDAAARQLLEVHHLLHRRRVAAAELGRPAGHEPARVELRALPPARPFGEVPRGAGPLREIGGRGGVDVEPGDEIGAEPLRLVVVVEAHRAAFLQAVPSGP